MRLTQGAFSFLPDLTDEQIVKQIQYAISKGWALNVEFTDDPHPRNSYWDLWVFLNSVLRIQLLLCLRLTHVVRLSHLTT
jgi:ribulose bisphosphate carboxylase small subunit